jgi:periplasmic protein TonB
MYAERTTTKLNPTSLAAAVGINSALLAALLFSSPELIKYVDPPIEGYNVPIDPPKPPPPERKVEAKADTRTTPQPTPPLHVPDTKIDLPTAPDVPLTGTTDVLPQPPLEAPAGEPAGTAVDPPKPMPVVVGAQPDARADFQPPYPPELRRTETEGRVTVRVLIGVDGRVKAVEPQGAGEPAFFEATRRHALARWRFKPATRDGVPFETWRTMSVRCELRD